MNKIKISATLSVEMNISCPHCNAYLDIFNEEDCNVLNDEGQLWNILYSSRNYDGWKNLNIECTCKECKKDFIFDELEY